MEAVASTQKKPLSKENQLRREALAIKAEAMGLLKMAQDNLETTILNDDSLKCSLGFLLESTTFDNAKFRNQNGSRRNNVIPGLVVALGDRSRGGAYDVWFERDEKGWVVAYDKMSGGL